MISFRLAIGSYSSPLVSSHRENTISAVLDKVDFADAHSASDAHQAIAKMGVIDRFCDWAFHGGTKAEALDALATLIIHNKKNRGGCSQPSDGSGPDTYSQERTIALSALAKLLSPAGTHALFTSSAEGGDEFPEYLTHEDQSRLATLIADEYAQANKPALAAMGYERAAKGYEKAGQPERAADVYNRAAKAHGKVAMGYEQMGYEQASQPEWAAKAYERAAEAHVLVAERYEGATLFDLAAVARKRAAKDSQMASTCYSKVAVTHQGIAVEAHERAAKATEWATGINKQEARRAAAAQTIQQAWKANRRHVNKLSEESVSKGPREKFVETVNKYGYLNYHYVDPKQAEKEGMPRTLTMVATSEFDEKLGENNNVAKSVRDFFVRDSKNPNGSFHADVAAPELYADIKSFVPAIQLSKSRSIAKNAGDDLFSEVVGKRKTLPISRFESVSRDLKKLHSRHIYHRDIKLENMTIGKDGLLKFIDCDSMFKQENEAPPKQICGTLAYTTDQLMSQQKKGQNLKAGDEFAFLLGVMASTSAQLRELESEGSGLDKSLGPAIDAWLRANVIPVHYNAVRAFLFNPSGCPLREDVGLHDMLKWRS